ncbi:hypothetical protein IAD21_01864 [Abditibacteriota bacterium]|nr:hypothetical protein IAD21_01864 [Abditibacteriota bacterium]
MKTDENMKSIVVASIRRHSMAMEEWSYTQLWDSGDVDVKAELSRTCILETSELPILYSYIDAENWTLVTTRRVFCSLEGFAGFVFVKDIVDVDHGNFKGYGGQEVERMQIRTKGEAVLSGPFETGKASMGTIYAVTTIGQITEK